ncbi:non-specific lipid transfer protein GPI-anchored 3 [Quercus suber]|uniref:non-specific lipid transfer protein GPI-anchored 3 n=1 Tax=Quercus suber TaxID=58331 RepID=UPI000CE25F59|nr:lipid transfer-like protein VAS [Quercus suber]
MASSNKQQILTLLVLFYSWFFVSFSQASFEFDAFRPVDSGSVKSFPCLGNLAVCQPYVKGPNIAPAICCKLLKDGIANDTKCLCNVFFYTDVLKCFNITPGELMKLPKDCGIDINLSICKKGSAFSDNSIHSSSLKSAANGITSVYLVWLVAVIISAIQAW